jgi:hypothetical protein
MRVVCLWAIFPTVANFQDMNAVAEDTIIIFSLEFGLARRQTRDNLLPLLIAEPKRFESIGLASVREPSL